MGSSAPTPTTPLLREKRALADQARDASLAREKEVCAPTPRQASANVQLRCDGRMAVDQAKAATTPVEVSTFRPPLAFIHPLANE